jgi:antirestriction protein ArdC
MAKYYPKTGTNKTTKNVKDIILDKLIAEMEAGTVPWLQTWTLGLPKNYMTGKPYRGINLLLLGSGEWLTFKQVTMLGGKVKKGAKGKQIVYFTVREKKGQEEKQKEDRDTFAVMKYYYVFNFEDTEGLPQKVYTVNHTPVEKAEIVLNSTTAKIEHKDPTGAYYSPIFDYINVPALECFPEIAGYYSTTFHELAHWTGAKDRLGRFDPKVDVNIFGSRSYSFEELVAEISAAMLCGITGIEQKTLKNSAASIEGWLKKFQGDRKMLFHAASKAQAAVDYIIGDNAKELGMVSEEMQPNITVEPTEEPVF